MLAFLDNTSQIEFDFIFYVWISGETSSGKSSLLNLLLGKEILPHRLLSCTSVICKLRYGPKLHARVVKDDDTVQDVPLDPDANPMQQLSRYIFKEDQREDKLPYKSVEIGLPLDILKVNSYWFPGIKALWEMQY